MAPHEILENLVKAMVTHPDRVGVTTEHLPDKMVLHLTVHPKDRGQVIGLDGDTASNIRTVLNAVGGKLRKRIELRIKD